MQKCLLYLGTFKSQMSPIKCVKIEENHVVTHDYLTDNSGNKLTWIGEGTHYKGRIINELFIELAQPLLKTEYGQFMLEMAGGK